MADPVYLETSVDYDGSTWFTEDPAMVRVRATDETGRGLGGGSVVMAVVQGKTIEQQKSDTTGSDGRAEFVVEIGSTGQYEVEIGYSDGTREGYVSAGTHDVRERQSLTFGPILSNMTAQSTGATTGEASVETNKGNGTLYWAADRSSSTPTTSQIESGQDANGGPADDAGSVAVSSSGTKTFTLSGLTDGVTYHVYAFQRDAKNRESGIVEAQLTTGAAGGGQLLYSEDVIAITIF